MSSELEASVEEESRAQWAQKSEDIRKDALADNSAQESEPVEDVETDVDVDETPDTLEIEE